MTAGLTESCNRGLEASSPTRVRKRCFDDEEHLQSAMMPITVLNVH